MHRESPWERGGVKEGLCELAFALHGQVSSYAPLAMAPRVVRSLGEAGAHGYLSIHLGAGFRGGCRGPWHCLLAGLSHVGTASRWGIQGADTERRAGRSGRARLRRAKCVRRVPQGGRCQVAGVAP